MINEERMSASDLIWTLLEVSERAACIARECRARDELSELLVQEKTGADKNPRVARDFKTLADVLVQETVKHYLCEHWPQLRRYIFGEEDNLFTNAIGQSIAVYIHDKEIETSQLLEEVLDNNKTAASLLAAAVHEEPRINLETIACFGKLERQLGGININVEDLAIWIDPIDGTNEYIKGGWDTVNERAKHGLNCCLILIGGYDRNTGIPLFGVVSQPFTQEDCTLTASYFCYGKIHNVRQVEETRDAIVVPSTEDPEVKERLAKVFTITTAAGAGYKILSVVLGEADAYVCSKSSTSRWDTCAPHALLSAIGGGIRTYEDNLPIVYNVVKSEALNSKGLIAYRSEEVLERVLSALRH